MSEARSPRGVIFDLDGTLIHSPLDFAAIRAEIGLGAGPVLETIALLEGEERRRAEAILNRHEESAARSSRLADGVREVFDHLREKRVGIAILTRNSRASLEIALRAHGLDADATRSRDDAPFKPSPEPVLSLCRQLGVAPGETLVVGDYLFDVEAANAAGAVSVLLLDGRNASFAPRARWTIRDLPELIALLD